MQCVLLIELYNIIIYYYYNIVQWFYLIFFLLSSEHYQLYLLSLFANQFQHRYIIYIDMFISVVFSIRHRA